MPLSEEENYEPYLNCLTTKYTWNSNWEVMGSTSLSSGFCSSSNAPSALRWDRTAISLVIEIELVAWSIHRDHWAWEILPVNSSKMLRKRDDWPVRDLRRYCCAAHETKILHLDMKHLRYFLHVSLIIGDILNTPCGRHGKSIEGNFKLCHPCEGLVYLSHTEQSPL